MGALWRDYVFVVKRPDYLFVVTMRMELGLVERRIAYAKAAGSNPVIRSNDQTAIKQLFPGIPRILTVPSFIHRRTVKQRAPVAQRKEHQFAELGAGSSILPGRTTSVLRMGVRHVHRS